MSIREYLEKRKQTDLQLYIILMIVGNKPRRNIKIKEELIMANIGIIQEQGDYGLFQPLSEQDQNKAKKPQTQKGNERPSRADRSDVKK